MLVAQRDAELRWRRPNGPVLGRLHAGARITVASVEGPWVRIAGLPFRSEQREIEIAAYVESSALAAKARPLAAFSFGPQGRAKRLPGVTGWLDDPEEPGHQSRAAWLGLDCHDSFLAEDGSVRQFENGVELVARDYDHLAQRPSVIQELLRCPARAGSEPLGAVINDPLPELIAHAGSVHWLREAPFEDGHHGELVCDEWRFSRAAHDHRRLTRRERFDGVVASFPFAYHGSVAQSRPTLALASLEYDRRPALRCDCPVDYTLLAASPAALSVTGHALEPSAASIDPADTERWFLSAEACESARAEATTKLERDGNVATSLGMHAVFGALGI
jgi:hypothetical protein